MGDEPGGHGRIRLPRPRVTPLYAIWRRVLLALVILGVMFVLVLVQRHGYTDSSDGHVSVLDALYYTTVSISTTGYGDIVPVSTPARLVTSLVVTPLRVIFLAVLVGTAFEVLTQRTRDEYRVQRWRSRVRNHTVVVGYGTKGRAAIATLLANGAEREQFVVVDRKSALITEANEDGVTGIIGDATRTSVLRQAKVDQAAYVVVAPDRDDAAVLITLTARQLNETAVIVTVIRESENEPLVLQSGASAVIASSEAAGRLLGFAALSPSVSHVFGDLLVHGSGLEIVERAVRSDEVGAPVVAGHDQVIAVVRAGTVIPFDSVHSLTTGDRLVVVRSA